MYIDDRIVCLILVVIAIFVYWGAKKVSDTLNECITLQCRRNREKEHKLINLEQEIRRLKNGNYNNLL